MARNLPPSPARGLTIGYYAHHHGTGHMRRAAAILGHVEAPTALLTSGVAPWQSLPSDTEVIELPPDTVCDSADPTAGGALHWAPAGPDHGVRSGVMVDWLSRPESALLVSDVSVEAAVLARLCGVAPVFVHQVGIRRDRPHRLGLDVAVGVLCPYPEIFEHPSVSAADRARRHYTGLMPTRTRLGDGAAPSGVRSGRRLAIVVGGGGTSFDPRRLPQLVSHLPGWHVDVLGPFEEAAGERWTVVGWVDDPLPLMTAADVVVATAGANTVSDVAAVGRPLVCVPEDRPFHEQRVRAERLAAHGMAAVATPWPPAPEWPGLIDRAIGIGGSALADLLDHAAPARTARWLENLAESEYRCRR